MKQYFSFVFLFIVFAITTSLLFQNCSKTQFQSRAQNGTTQLSPINNEEMNGSEGNPSSNFFSPPPIPSARGPAENTVVPAPPQTVNSSMDLTPGRHCGYVKSLSGLGYRQLLKDYSAAFDGSYLKVGESMPWASGIITRQPDGSLFYTDPKAPSASFIMRRTDSPSDIARIHGAAHFLWIKKYGVSFRNSRIQLEGSAAGLNHLFGYPMGPNRRYNMGDGNFQLEVSTDSVPGNYTFHTPDGPMTSVQFLSSTWCLAMTSDWGQPLPQY